MAKFEDLAVRYMVDLIRDFDLEDFQAAGIVGNGGGESRGFTDVQEDNPTVAGSAGGLGHFQWTGRSTNNNRRLVFEQWLARNADKGWTAETYEANYSMLFRELVGTERAALAALKTTRTLDEATEVFMLKFERPGIPHLEGRMSWARRALTAFKAAGHDAAALRAQDRPGSTVLPGVGQLPALKTNFDIQALLPLILGVLTMLQNRQEQATGRTPDIMELLNSILEQGLQPAKPAEPPAPPKPATTVVQKPSVQLSIGALVASALGMATGTIGTPFGMGEVPTQTGTLATLLPIGSALMMK